MDPLTHAASGAVAMLALPNRPATFWAAPLAAVACAAPDIDLAFIHTPLEFLQLHRGLSHSFAFMPFFGLLLALLCWPLWRKSTPLAWKFWQVWLFCCGMILLHIWLDVVTTYGTMVFIPFSHYRVRFNSIYIIDLLVTVPLLWAVWRWRHKRNLMLAVLIWTFVYPASGILINQWHTAQWRQKFSAENRPVVEMHILPDAFAPFFWRLIYEEQTSDNLVVEDISLDALGRQREGIKHYTAANPALVNKFIKDSISGDTFFHFAMLPVEQPLPEQYWPHNQPPNSSYQMYHDLRFGTGLKFVAELLAMRPNADMPFLFMAELENGNGEMAGIGRLRLRFSDSGRDSDWHEPDKPQPPTFWQWLVGLR